MNDHIDYGLGVAAGLMLYLIAFFFGVVLPGWLA